MPTRLKPICAAVLVLGTALNSSAAFAADALEADQAASAHTEVQIRNADGVQTRIVTRRIGPGAPAEGDAMMASMMPEAFQMAFATPPRRIVKNAPYSAEVITETVQTLADGNQINKQQSRMTWRDSSGRTRQETRNTKGEILTAQIQDSTEGTRLILVPSSKIAIKIAEPRRMGAMNEIIRERAKAAKDGKRPAAEHAHGDEQVSVTRNDVTGADGKTRREETFVRVIKMNNDGGADKAGHPPLPPLPPLPPMPPAVDGQSMGEAMLVGPMGAAFGDHQWRAKAVTTDLGTREFDGIKANGKRISYTIPAGEAGNKNPITVSDENWVSPELQVTVYSKHSDPRRGDTVYRLAKLQRAEPAANLFTVPEGYSVRESKMAMPPAPPAPPAAPAKPAAAKPEAK